jgi:hypothetical protein
MQTGVIDTIGVRDQRVSHGTQVKELVPVSVAPGQARDLNPEHDPDLAQADIRHQPRKPLPAVSALGRHSQITVNHHDITRRPTECHGAIAQFILTGQALRIVLNLCHRRLSHIHIRRALHVRPLNFASHWSLS